MAEETTTTYILIINSKTYEGIGYDREGNVVKQNLYYGPDFTDGIYRETVRYLPGGGKSTDLERISDVPPGFTPKAQPPAPAQPSAQPTAPAQPTAFLAVQRLG